MTGGLRSLYLKRFSYCYIGARGYKKANMATSRARAAIRVDKHVAMAAHVAARPSNLWKAPEQKRPQVLRWRSILALAHL